MSRVSLTCFDEGRKFGRSLVFFGLKSRCDLSHLENDERALGVAPSVMISKDIDGLRATIFVDEPPWGLWDPEAYHELDQRRKALHK